MNDKSDTPRTDAIDESREHSDTWTGSEYKLMADLARTMERELMNQERDLMHKEQVVLRQMRELHQREGLTKVCVDPGIHEANYRCLLCNEVYSVNTEDEDTHVCKREGFVRDAEFGNASWQCPNCGTLDEFSVQHREGFVAYGVDEPKQIPVVETVISCHVCDLECTDQRGETQRKAAIEAALAAAPPAGEGNQYGTWKCRKCGVLGKGVHHCEELLVRNSTGDRKTFAERLDELDHDEIDP